MRFFENIPKKVLISLGVITNRLAWSRSREMVAVKGCFSRNELQPEASSAVAHSSAAIRSGVFMVSVLKQGSSVWLGDRLLAFPSVSQGGPRWTAKRSRA